VAELSSIQLFEKLITPQYHIAVSTLIIIVCISVGIATGYGLDGPGIESRWGARLSAPVQTGPGAHPASCTMSTGSFPGIKRPGCGAEPSTPSNAEV
jgi:hypothetical protein